MERLSIVISGMLAGDPNQGGATWAVLQYVLGLRALRHHVLLVEPVQRLTPASAQYFHAVVRQFGLEDSAALLLTGTHTTVGVPYGRLRRAAAGADLLLNISGMLRDEVLTSGIGVRAYVDLDPAFNQLWHALEGIDVGLDRHNRFVTVGQALGEPACPVPVCGRTWLKTLPPVFLPLWAQAPHPCREATFTTVAHWRSYGTIDFNGLRLGQKAHSIRELIDLPRRTSERLLLALAIHHDEVSDRRALAAHGWRLVDPQRVAATPNAYRDFIRSSKGELGIAKSGYVAARCGWFSDRSACYLACGRPVLMQDTGSLGALSAAPGLRSFSSAEEACDGLARIALDYAAEARGARRLAEQELDSAKVLAALLECVR